MHSNCLLSEVQISASSIPMDAPIALVCRTICQRRTICDSYCLTPVRRLDGLSSFNLMKLAKGAALFNRLVARGVDFTAMRGERGATLCHHVAYVASRVRMTSVV
jgi:hypothetical protein